MCIFCARIIECCEQHPVWMLGTEHGFFARAERILSCWTVSPAPEHEFLDFLLYNFFWIFFKGKYGLHS